MGADGRVGDRGAGREALVCQRVTVVFLRGLQWRLTRRPSACRGRWGHFEDRLQDRTPVKIAIAMYQIKIAVVCLA
jgi:hypothetical protein